MQDKKNRPSLFCVVCGKRFFAFNPRQVCCHSGDCEKKYLAMWKTKRPMNHYIKVYYPTHPRADKAGMVQEHVVVAEKKYGRSISRKEHIHHINGNKSDNHPDNLEVLTSAQHRKVHTSDTPSHYPNEDSEYDYKEMTTGYAIYMVGPFLPAVEICLTLKEVRDSIGEIKKTLREEYGVEYFGGSLQNRHITFGWDEQPYEGEIDIIGICVPLCIPKVSVPVLRHPCLIPP